MEAVEEQKTTFEPSKDEIEIDTTEAQETEVELSKEADDKEPAVEVEDSNEQEQQVSSAQKRINQLTKKMRDAEKREKEAIRYAQQVQTQAKALEEKVQSLDKGYMEQYGKSLEIETAQAKANLKHAIDIGDSDAIVAAQEQLSTLGARNVQYSQAQQRQETVQERAQENGAQAQPAQQAQPTEIKRPDPKAEDWAAKNVWFGKDEVMTFAALGYIKNLLKKKGLTLRAMSIIMNLIGDLFQSFRKSSVLANVPLRRLLELAAKHLGAVKGLNSPRPKLQ